jgi:hypothetical protein
MGAVAFMVLSCIAQWNGNVLSLLPMGEWTTDSAINNMTSPGQATARPTTGTAGFHEIRLFMYFPEVMAQFGAAILLLCSVTNGKW